jgi:phosphoribosylformylglycinamidine synthase PurS subunit
MDADCSSVVDHLQKIGAQLVSKLGYHQECWCPTHVRDPAQFIIPTSFMKAYVTVMLKTTVLDPQGKTIHGALTKMGYKGVGAVRQGKFFELALDAGLDKAAAKTEVERIAKEVLTNPVIEEFSYRLEE